MSLKMIEIELKILKKENELAILRKQLEIEQLKTAKQELASSKVNTGKNKEPTPADAYKHALTKDKAKAQPFQYVEDECSDTELWYVVHTGPKIGMYNTFEKVRDLPEGYFHTARSKFEAKHILQDIKQKYTQRVPVFQKMRAGRNAETGIKYSRKNSINQRRMANTLSKAKRQK